MRKTLYSVCLVLLLMAGVSFSVSPGYITAPVVEANAGVEDIWSDMEISDDGSFNPGKANDPNSDANFGEMTNKYKGVVQFIIGLLLISSFFGMITQITKLALAGDNEMARKNAMKGIFVCGAGIFFMGAAELIVSTFWTALVA